MFIVDLKAISPQLTYNNELLAGEVTSHNDKVYHVIEPDYMQFIPAGLLRRMGKAVRMGVGTGLPLVKAHPDLEAVIIGTANGGLEDCIKFLNQIVEYDEGVLTPTNFVQSTPNAVAGQLALMGGNRGYNITYTNGGLSFENAVLDALLLFEEGEVSKLLLGGLEEISDYNYNIDSLSNKFKKEIVSDKELLASSTQGTVCGEGACMFVLSNNPSNALAKIVDVNQWTYPSLDEIGTGINKMIEKNNLSLGEIDTVILGYNGDIDHNSWYDHVGNDLFPNSRVLSFKNLIGDYRSCSSFALWMASHILHSGSIDIPAISLRDSERPIKNVLIYNHFDAVRHGAMLIQGI